MWLVYPLFFIIGAVAAVFIASWPLTETLFKNKSVNIPPNALTPDIASAVKRKLGMSYAAPKLDSRLTGAGPIDDELNDIINYLIRDCVLSWYNSISPDQAFPTELKKVLREAIVITSSQCKQIDWVYF
eukprot:gene23821-14162_t